MRLHRALAAQVLGLVHCALAASTPYLFDPDNNLRPDNVTNLDYTRYDKIGSYYNGTLEFNYELLDLPEVEGYLYSGEVCDEHVNETLRITLDAVVGIQKRRKNDSFDNPFFLIVWAWDSQFTLGPADKTANYSEHQFFQVGSVDGDDVVWDFDMVERDDPFGFSGYMTNDTVFALDWKFNATGVCESKTSEDLLFSSRALYPGDGGHDWVESIPPTTIAGEFDDMTASLYIDGLFEALGMNTKLAGSLSIRFSGQVDQDRSDKLLLDGENPAWEPVLGFREEDGDDDSGAMSVIAGTLMVFGSSICVTGLLCF